MAGQRRGLTSISRTGDFGFRGALTRKAQRRSVVGKTPRILKNERQRLDTIVTYCGCLPCLLIGHLDRHTTIEHVTEHGRRVGKGSDTHLATIGLCTWHHFGHRPNSSTRQHMAGEFGPPLAWGRREFEEYFGDELKVLGVLDAPATGQGRVNKAVRVTC